MYDREGRNPVESWADLHREGYLACAVPVAHGGMGLDMATYVAVIRGIARGCASTAMTLHMHSTVMRFIDALGTDEQKRRYYPEVVERGRPGSATSVGVVEGFALGYAAVYVGIAEAAFDFAADYVKKRVVKPENVPVSHDPGVQRQIGDLEARLDAARLVLHDSASRWEGADVAQRGQLANRAKYLTTEIGLHVTSLA